MQATAGPHAMHAGRCESDKDHHLEGQQSKVTDDLRCGLFEPADEPARPGNDSDFMVHVHAMSISAFNLPTKSFPELQTLEEAECQLLPLSALQRNCRSAVGTRLLHLGFGAKQPAVGLSGGSLTSIK